MAAYVSVYPLTQPGSGTWFGQDAWFDTTTPGFGQPGAGDTVYILDTTPTIIGAYIDGSTIWMSTGTDSSLGLSATNSVIGSDTTLFMTGGTTSQPQLTLDDSLLYGRLYVQQGTGSIDVTGQSYGASYGTIIVGGVTGASGTLQQASLTVNAYGTWSNIGNMYVFANGTGDLSTEQPMTNYGALSANDGSLLITENGSKSVFTNSGQIYAEDTGKVTTNAIMTQNGGVTVNDGTFVLGSTTNGLGAFNLVSGTMEFLYPFAGNGTVASPYTANFASTLTTEFSGNAFNLAFADFSDLSTAVTGHELSITGTYYGQVETLSLTLDTAHTYRSSQFTTTAADTSGLTHVIYTI